MNKKEIFNFFSKMNLVERYTDLCKRFSNFDNSKKPKKDEVYDFLQSFGVNLTFSKTDNIFYEDFKIENSNFRFYISTSYGMIGAVFMIWDDNESTLNQNFYEISEEIDNSIEENIENRFPISTSQQDLEEILEEILSIYKEFKKEFILNK